MSSARFVALDVETANADIGSICQVGVATFEDGLCVDRWSTLVDPEDDFDYYNVAIHGITPETVKGAPKFREIESKLRQQLEADVAACYTHFDRTAINLACERYEIRPFATTWLDVARVVRRAWPQFALKGYKLKNVSKFLGISLEYHHNALCDALAAGEILTAAMREQSMSVTDWLDRLKQPLSSTPNSPIAQAGNPEGVLFGESICFTGQLSMSRRDAAASAAAAGCHVTDGVTKKTTLLVVGDQDARKVGSDGKSGKQIKAEQLIAQGQDIRVVGETDFLRVVGTATT